MKLLRVTHQVRDAETYKIIAYVLEDEYSNFRVTPKQMLSYVKNNKIINAHLYKSGIMYFTLSPMNAYNFISYHYSDNLKAKLNDNYNKWREQYDRRMALNIQEKFIYKYKYEDGLYNMYETYVNTDDIDLLEIPSFIAEIKGSSVYNFNISYYENESDIVGVLSNRITSVFIDKYTNGIYGSMLSGLHDKIDLNGLTSFIYGSLVPVPSLPNNENKLALKTEINLSGKCRYVGKYGFDTVGCNISINCGKHLRVLEVSGNMHQIKCYDTTLLLHNSQKVTPVIIKDTQKRNKDMLLDYKDHIKDIISEYDTLVYDVLEDRVLIRFSTEACLLDFINGLNFVYTMNRQDMSLSFLAASQSGAYKNSDSLYWKLKSEVNKKIEEKSIAYAFAVVL